MIKKLFAIIFLTLLLSGVSFADDYSGLTLDQAKRLNQYNRWIEYDNNFRRIHKISSNVVKDTTSQTVKIVTELDYKSGLRTLKKPSFINLTKTVGPGIIAGAALYGVWALGENYVDWLISQGDPNLELHKKDGLIYKYEEDGEAVAPCSIPANYVWHCCAADSAAAYAECRTYAESCGSPVSLCGQTGARGLNQGKWHYVMIGTPTYQKKEVPATELDLTDAADNGYDNDVEKSLNILTDIVNDIKEALQNPDHKFWGGVDGDTSTDDTPQHDASKKISDQVPAADATEAEDELTDPTTEPTPEEEMQKDEDDHTVDKTLIGINTILRNMNKQAAGENLSAMPPMDGAGEPPEMGTVKPIFDGFMDGLSQLPIVSFLTDLKDIEMSGSCEVTLQMPNPFKNASEARTVTFCDFQNTFEFMGSCLLLFTAFVWMRYLFEG